MQEKHRTRVPRVEYIPSSFKPAGVAKPSCSLFKDAAPEAVSSPVWHQQSTTKYSMTLKQETNIDGSTMTYPPLLLSEAPEMKNQPQNTFVPSSKMEQEIRNARYLGRPT
ncbi:hypothetical protein MTO96_013515 [Rhipicephalus appendiculatus]